MTGGHGSSTQRQRQGRERQRQGRQRQREDRQRRRAAARRLSAFGERGTEQRVAGLTLGTLMVVGGAMGSLNLVVHGVVRDGMARWLYAATMALLVVLAVPLILRPRITRGQTFLLVLVGQLVYVDVSVCIANPAHFSSPLMLLFTCFVAAWFLEGWQLAVTMLGTPVACLVALWDSFGSGAELAIQVSVSAGMLDATAFGVFVLRRRVQRLLEATQALSTTDPLTGLHNRRQLEEQVPRIWRQARRDGTRVVAMVLDLDHFKRLNDTHGHAAGDSVLIAVARSLGATVRPADVLARTGGEELVVLGLVGDPSEAMHLGERLRAAVAGTATPDGHRVTASIGVALARPVDGESPTDGLWRLVDRADAAMYEAKQRGRDRVATARVPLPRTGELDVPVPAAEPAVREDRPGRPAPDVR